MLTLLHIDGADNYPDFGDLFLRKKEEIEMLLPDILNDILEKDTFRCMNTESFPCSLLLIGKDSPDELFGLVETWNQDICRKAKADANAWIEEGCPIGGQSETVKNAYFSLKEANDLVSPAGHHAILDNHCCLHSVLSKEELTDIHKYPERYIVAEMEFVYA